jgi:hypothetical protein
MVSSLQYTCCLSILAHMTQHILARSDGQCWSAVGTKPCVPWQLGTDTIYNCTPAKFHAMNHVLKRLPLCAPSSSSSSASSTLTQRQQSWCLLDTIAAMYFGSLRPDKDYCLPDQWQVS